MAEETIRLLSIKHHDDQESRFDPDHLHDQRAGPLNHLTDPPRPTDTADSVRLIEDDENEEGERKQSPTSLEQKLTFIGIAITCLTSAMSTSVLAPFFPYEAEKRGVNPTETGLVFGIFYLVSFIASPVWGKYLPVIGGKFMFLSGFFVTAGCNILFGFLDKIEGKTTFLVYCYVIRIVEALGSAATATAALAIGANVYPEKVAQVTSFLEIFLGLGFSVGPPLGSLFYAIGGYKLPFIVIGCTAMTSTILNIFTIPSVSSSSDEDQGAGSFMDVLKIPAVWVMLICCMWGTASLCLVEVTLTLHLTSPPFGVKPYIAGVLFFLHSAIYAIFSPIGGYIADTRKTTRTMIAVGIFLSGISLMLIGPSPLFHLPGQLWIIILSLGLFGFGLAFVIVQTFLDMLDSANWYGLPDNLTTQSIVSGLFNGAFSFGAFVGPVAGGALVNQFGFDWSTTYFAGGCFGSFILICLFGVWEFGCGKGRRKPSHMTESS